MPETKSRYRPRVFVVMPFGRKAVPKTARIEPAVPESAHGDPTLIIDFNEVYQRLLAPALIEAGCQPFRADQQEGAGDIRKDMFFELVTADVVLADISILNANVFYELGVRHGVARGGVLTVHAGWSDRPFDIAPDRTFSYDGKLFEPPVTRDEAWQKAVAVEVAKLATTLRAAMAVEEQTTGSPVYEMLDGLQPVDWSGIRTDRAKYFGSLSEEWRQRVKVARKERHPGDILTLADDVPTRLHRRELLWQCARALVELRRFEQAQHVLEDILEMACNDFDARSLLALVNNRLGRSATAEESLAALAAERPGDGEAQGMLGRVYKDMWRVSWSKLPTLEERRLAAIDNAVCAVRAIESYDRAFRCELGDFYNGINVATLQSLLDFLAEQTGGFAPDTAIKDLPDLRSIVRVAARSALKDPAQLTWAAPTLGELALLLGEAGEARARYTQAANAPNAPYFEIESMLSQVRLFELLGFRPEAVAPVVKLLEKKLAQLGSPQPSFKKVSIFSGHMIDAPDRATPRFPAAKERAVCEAIARQLDSWGFGAGDLAISGAARGGDILFAEECQRRGVHVRLLLALPRDEFIAESVRLPDSNWVSRCNKLLDSCEVAYQHERLGAPPEGLDVFSRCNLWMINTARVEVGPSNSLFALLVWDEMSTGDGPGGTSDFYARVEELGAEIKVINPTEL